MTKIRVKLPALLLLCLLALLLCGSAMAAEAVTYVGQDGNDATCDTYTVVDSTTLTWNNGWYVVNSDVTVPNDRIVASGVVNLILCDGATLDAKQGIMSPAAPSCTSGGRRGIPAR